jgi:integrase
VRTEVKVGPKRGTRPVPFRNMARLAALTLMRLTEVRTLRREMVDLTQGVVTLPRTKTEPRHVVLNAEAREILKRVLDTAKGEYVFPNPDGKPYSRVYIGRVWRAAARAVSGPIVQALGGWKSEKMMRCYAAVTDKTLRAAAEAISGNSGWRPVLGIQGQGGYHDERGLDTRRALAGG